MTNSLLVFHVYSLTTHFVGSAMNFQSISTQLLMVIIKYIEESKSFPFLFSVQYFINKFTYRGERLGQDILSAKDCIFSTAQIFALIIWIQKDINILWSLSSVFLARGAVLCWNFCLLDLPCVVRTLLLNLLPYKYLIYIKTSPIKRWQFNSTTLIFLIKLKGQNNIVINATNFQV